MFYTILERQIITVLKDNPEIWYSARKLYNTLHPENTTTYKIAHILMKLKEQDLLECRTRSNKGNKIHYYRVDRSTIYTVITILDKQYLRMTIEGVF